MEDPITLTAQTIFGIPYVYPWQRLVIANILDAAEATLAAKDEGALLEEALFDEDGSLRSRQIVLLPTGAGKSLCFQIPAVHLSGPTLVIYPLLALMGDQKRRMEETTLSCALFRGSQSREERLTQFKRLEGSDGYKKAQIIIANPEVLALSEVAEAVKKAGIAHLAIDEAHCVSEWGESFRPSFLKIADLISFFNPLAVTAFTATASETVLSRMSEILFNGKAHLVRGESDRPNLHYSVIHAFSKERALVQEVLLNQRPTVVFCATRGGSERAALILREILHDTDIRFYHAGLKHEEKQEVEQWFHSHDNAILCTTCAWGMGVDKKNVRTVIHKDASPTAEAYIQEAGRGGRDGKESSAILIWSPLDSLRVSLMQEGLAKERKKILVKYCEGNHNGKEDGVRPFTKQTCRRELLLEAMGDTRAGEHAIEGTRIACSFCDICDGTAQKGTVDLQIVYEFIKKNPKSFSTNEAAGILERAGNQNSLMRFGKQLWRRGDFTKMIEFLEKLKYIQTVTSFFWKGKLKELSSR